MEMQRSNPPLALLAAALLLTSAGLETRTIAADGVVLFAPGNYKHLNDAPYHAKAAEQIHHRLLKAGTAENRIVQLRGEQATAQAFRDALGDITDSTGSDDLFLVVICSQGVQFDDRDYVLAADTPQDAQQEIGKPDGRIIPILDVLEEMALSASNRRVLIVDGAGQCDPSLADATARFGRLFLETTDGQWVILNRSAHLSRRGDEPPLTDFAWSLLDGITFHADGNRDGAVSLLELADYMKLYAEGQQNPLPRIAGKTTGDVSLVSTSAADDGTFPREALAANARRLVAEARKTLLLELDVRAALALLDRAKRLCGDPDLQQEINEVSVTAGLLHGEADRVLPLSEDKDSAFLAVLPREAGVYAAGASAPSQRLPAGTVVQITHRAVSTANGHNWTYVSAMKALLPEWNAGQVSFTPISLPAESVWMLAGDLVASPEQTVPAATLRQQFLKPTGVEESPATTETGDVP